MIGSQDLAADPPGQPSDLSLVNIAKGVKILVQKGVEDVGVEVTSVLGQVCDLVQETSVHYDEVRTHLVERTDVVRQVCEPKHQSGSASS